MIISWAMGHNGVSILWTPRLSVRESRGDRSKRWFSLAGQTKSRSHVQIKSSVTFSALEGLKPVPTVTLVNTVNIFQKSTSSDPSTPKRLAISYDWHLSVCRL